LTLLAAVPTQAQEPVGRGFFYQAASQTEREGLALESIGYQERGMTLVWSCPGGRPAISMVPHHPVPAGPVRVSWRLDADSVHVASAFRPTSAPRALFFPSDHWVELTRGASTSSWLVVRVSLKSGEERAWAYSLADAEQALDRLSCVRAARQADAAGWQRRPRISITPEVRQVQGEPPEEPGAPASAGPPREGPPPSAGPPGEAGTVPNEAEGAGVMLAEYPRLPRDANVAANAMMDVALEADGRVDGARM
jgi:hypothetical protein